MTFTSLYFYLFLPVVYLAFYWTADRWRWLVLLTASYGFYASFKAPYLLAVLLAVTGISYASALRIATQRDENSRKRWLWLGSFACVAILALMKYLPFLEAKNSAIFGLNAALTETLISIGVSYFTFQAISYLADVYLEIEDPEHHFGYYALYLAFFPKLLQGPIERARDLLPQLKQPYRFDYDAMRSGMLLFTWGLYKKLVIADRFGLYADQVFNNLHSYTGLPLLLATYAYAFQIYFDFSAYTDMARGVGRMFGINLTENFNSPYLATSIADFWRRWHISFSRWILDYIFKPLQMGWRDWGQKGTALALIITFLISGIWHGATWGFVIWGLLHGIYLAASTYYRPYQKKLHAWLGIGKSPCTKWWQVFITFNLVCFAWIFFRLTTLKDCFYLVTSVFVINSTQYSNAVEFIGSQILLGRDKFEFLLLVIAITTAYTAYMFRNFRISERNPFVRWSTYCFLLLSIVWIGCYKNSSFIYLQF